MDRIKKIGKWGLIAIFFIWSIIAVVELSMKPPGTSPSIISQLWINYGTFFAFLFGILFWFIRASGLSELRSHVKRSKEHMEKVERKLGIETNSEESD